MKIYCLGPVSPRFTAITNATNANPIVITATAHQIVATDVLTISGVLGNTNANGTYLPGQYTLTTNTITLTGVSGNAGYTSGGYASAPQQLITWPTFPVIPGVTDNTKVMACRMLFTPVPAGTATLYIGTTGLNQATLKNVFRPINPPPATGIFDYYDLELDGYNVLPLVDYWVDAAKPGTEAVLVSFWIR